MIYCIQKLSVWLAPMCCSVEVYWSRIVEKGQAWVIIVRGYGRRTDQLCHGVKTDGVDMIFRAQSGHSGALSSAADIIADLYSHKIKLDPENPSWPGRDRFIYPRDMPLRFYTQP